MDSDLILFILVKNTGFKVVVNCLVQTPVCLTFYGIII